MAGERDHKFVPKSDAIGADCRCGLPLFAHDWTCPGCGATCAPDEGVCMLCGAEESVDSGVG